nr:hypothetical protein [Kiritimatiellia bacterium]
RTNWTTDVDKHNTNESAHADIRAEVATNAFNIAAFPTNQAYARVMAWDTGSNCWLRVTWTNWTQTVWEWVP